MSECLACEKAFCCEDASGITACDGDEYGICPTCRADLEFGRMVREYERGMCMGEPKGSEVQRLHGIIKELDSKYRWALDERNKAWKELGKIK